MAHNDREIEIRSPVDEEKFSQIKEELQEKIKFVKTSYQKDEYFTPAHRDFLSPQNPFEWLSIRERNGGIINYKHFHPEEAETKTHCDEFELEIGDAEKLRKIFSSLDIRSLVVVEKEREIYEADGVEISLDKVKDLGHFIEIEATGSGSVEETREKLFDFAKTLGLDVSKAVNKGYLTSF